MEEEARSRWFPSNAQSERCLSPSDSFRFVQAMAVQGAAYTGYIEVKMDRIQSDLAKTVDKDCDGKVNMNDFKLYWSKFRTMMLHNVSRENAAGFSLGFLYGITNA